MSCFVIGSMKALTYSQRAKFSQAASDFYRIKTYNTDIRYKRNAGNKSLSYYTFVNAAEKASYTLGQFVLTQNDPVGASNGNYNDVIQI